MRLPKRQNLIIKRCEIRSGHFCYCYIDYWSYGNRKCKAGSTGKTDHRTCRRSDSDDHSFDDRLCMASELLLDLYGINIIALVLCKAVWNQCNGAQRWIDIGVTNFQPSELSKILVVVFFAKFLMNHEDDLNSAATILKAVGLIAPTLILIVLQPDLSTTLSIALVFCAMMYLAGLSYRFIGTLIAILVPVTIILSVLLYSQISHFCTIISKSVFWHGWNRRNMQVMKLTSRIMQLWRLVPDSLPVKD